MSRRREAREQEKQDFLEQNPDLIDYTTRIEPVNSGGLFNVDISHNGGPELPGSPFATSLNAGDGLAVGLLDGPDFFLFAQDSGPLILDSTSQVTINAKGIGVEDTNNPAADGFGIIEDGEILGIYMDENNFFFPGSAPSPTEVDEFGATSLGVDFIGRGSGTVQLQFLDEDTGELVIEEMAFGSRGRRGSEGRFEAEPESDHIFEAVGITTTGSLEISVVGIDLGTNFESGFGASI